MGPDHGAAALQPAQKRRRRARKGRGLAPRHPNSRAAAARLAAAAQPPRGRALTANSSSALRQSQPCGWDVLRWKHVKAATNSGPHGLRFSSSRHGQSSAAETRASRPWRGGARREARVRARARRARRESTTGGPRLTSSSLLALSRHAISYWLHGLCGVIAAPSARAILQRDQVCGSIDGYTDDNDF